VALSLRHLRPLRLAKWRCMALNFPKNRRSEPHTVLVRNQTRNSVLTEFAEVADTSATRRKGLLGRSGLAAGEGIWIIPCSAVHSLGMKFTIDVVYLNRALKVRKVRPGMAPWQMSMCLFAHSVLELPSGTIDRTQTRTGDQLEFLPST
jgi:uncharacterized protein